MKSKLTIATRLKDKQDEGAKRLLFLQRVAIIINAIFWVTGPGVTGLGIWLYIVLGVFDPVIKRTEFSVPAYLITTAGLISVLGGIFGCIGTVTFSRRLLMIYFGMMSVVWTMEAISAVLCFLSYDEAVDTIHRMINYTIPGQYWTSAAFTSTIDLLQRELSCCGGQSFQDWTTSPHYITTADANVNSSLQTLPLSCCLHNLTLCRQLDGMGQPMFPELLHHSGCATKLVERTCRILAIAGWTVTGTAGMMLLGMSAVCCFIKSLKDFFS
ncbi:CD151 antigen-like [Pomacea canaliculata]|uniref:CD151 antigen-like n=1 Tax=Pomacea canaliculata TaxID=400727 RepID=UPI000D72DFC0|nr:CD151 antigen-like [Pomacea canaliculata]